jgi:hypothetical protein
LINDRLFIPSLLDQVCRAATGATVAPQIVTARSRTALP